MSSNIKYLIHVSSLSLLMFHLIKSQLDEHHKLIQDQNEHDKPTQFNISLYAILFLITLPIPHMILNFLGLLLLNTFPTRVHVLKKSVESKQPKLCFRIMTKGYDQNRALKNLSKNYYICQDAGLKNYHFEYLTEDEKIKLEIDTCKGDGKRVRFRKILVPKEYETSSKSSYRARLLEYALEDKVNQLDKGDYIVHLDEDIMLTRDFIHGLINFVHDNRHSFGKPNIITYGHKQLLPSISQLMETMRISDSMGRSRFQLQVLNKPIYSIQGNCFVAKYEAEREIGFNYGPLDSIFYDFNFAMKSMEKNYSWTLIDGHVCDQSDPVIMNNVMDLVKQRKGFVDAMCLMVHSNNIPMKHKLLFSLPLYAWLSFPILVLISMYDTTPRPIWMNTLELFCLSLTLYMHLFGVVLLFDFEGLRILLLPLFFIGTILAFIFTLILDLFVITYTLVTIAVQLMSKLKCLLKPDPSDSERLIKRNKQE